MTATLEVLRTYPYGWLLLWGLIGWSLLAALTSVGLTYIVFLRHEAAIWRDLYLGGGPTLPRPSRVPGPPTAAPVPPMRDSSVCLPPPLPTDSHPTLHWTPREQHALRAASYRRPK
jgi:hypothetical protein